MRTALRRVLTLAVIAGLVWASQRWWRERTEPDRALSPATPWPPVPVEPHTQSASAGQASAVSAPAEREQVLELTASVRAVTVRGAAGGVEPDDGACPDGHPVKAKLRSRIYHLPGMAAYDRTVPDRCYRSAEEAEEDGFRRAKH